MPPPSSDQASREDGDSHPCPEEEEFFQSRPDAADMEEAIGKFMEGMENLNFWTRELEDVVREIMEDQVFKGNQNFHSVRRISTFSALMVRYIPVHTSTY